MWRHPFSSLVTLLLRLISLLPFRLLYLVSDLLYPMVYHLISYRKEVVMSNLRNAFPALSEPERRKIARDFYRHFCDLAVEITKMITIRPEKLLERIEFSNRDIIDRYREKGKTVLVAVGHYGNWEWLNSFATLSGYPMMAVYKYLNNPVFDNLFYRLRERFGTLPVPMKQTLRTIKDYRENDKAVICCFITDQCPVREELDYFSDFLGQDTPVFLGIEKLARKFGYPVVFASMEKTGRGRYRVSILPVHENPSVSSIHEITKKHVGLLEKQIVRKPELWMWTHRRWKFSRKDVMRRNLSDTPPEQGRKENF